MNGTDALLTTRQLQELLQVDRITIYRMLNDGRLQGFKVGGQWRFSRQAIEGWLREQQDGLEATASPAAAGELSSPHSLPLSCTQAIQDIFAEALGVGAVTTTMEGAPLTARSNTCQFCDLIHSTETGRQRCADAWRAATAGPPRSPSRLSPCYAGLSLAWNGIQVQGELVAAIFAGQFLVRPPERDTWLERMAELSAVTGLDASRLEAAWAGVPVLDGDRQRQVCRLLGRVAATLSEIGEERGRLLGRLQRIAEMTAYR